MFNIILASKSKVRKEILEKNNIKCLVDPSNVDEEPIKISLLNEGASPEIVSKSVLSVFSFCVSNVLFLHNPFFIIVALRKNKCHCNTLT